MDYKAKALNLPRLTNTERITKTSPHATQKSPDCDRIAFIRSTSILSNSGSDERSGQRSNVQYL